MFKAKLVEFFNAVFNFVLLVPTLIFAGAATIAAWSFIGLLGAFVYYAVHG